MKRMAYGILLISAFALVLGGGSAFGQGQRMEDYQRKLAETFGGIRVSSDYLKKLTGSTTFVNLTILDEGLSDTSDLRVDSLTSFAVLMTGHFALKTSLRFLFDNAPSFVRLPLTLPSGMKTDVLVPVQAEELDTVFTVALVINF